MVLVVAWVGHAVLGPFIVAAVVAYAFSPLVSTAERRLGWPRPLIVLFGSDTIVLGTQTISVAAIAAQIQDSLTHLLGPGDALNVARSVGESALKSVLVLIVAFYFLVDGPEFHDLAVRLFPMAYRARTVALLSEIHAVLGRWLRGQLFLIVLVAAVVYVILGPIMGLRYALAIGILTGILEIIPLVGPIIAAGIAATDAVMQGGLSTAGVVIVVYIVLRQVEDQLVMPVVIGRAVHLHPIVTIFAVLIGLEVYGVLGGLLGVPAAAAINVVFHALYPHGVQAVDEAIDAAAPPGRSPPAESAAAAPAVPKTAAAAPAAGKTAGPATDPGPATRTARQIEDESTRAPD